MLRLKTHYIEGFTRRTESWFKPCSRKEKPQKMKSRKLTRSGDIMDHAIKEQILTSTRLAWWTKLNLTEVIPFSNTKSIENMSTCLKQEIGFVIVWKGLFWITKCFLKFSLVLILWFQLYSPSICVVRHFELYKQVLGGKSAHWFIILITFFFCVKHRFCMSVSLLTQSTKINV